MEHTTEIFCEENKIKFKYKEEPCPFNVWVKHCPKTFNLSSPINMEDAIYVKNQINTIRVLLHLHSILNCGEVLSNETKNHDIVINIETDGKIKVYAKNKNPFAVLVDIESEIKAILKDYEKIIKFWDCSEIPIISTR